MDSFDDLLSPSRNILEENPFEDPFAKLRSDPLDPWSSFGQQQQSLPSHSDIDYFKSGFEDHPSTTQTTEPYFTNGYDHSGQAAVTVPADPLDAATVTAEDHEDEQSASHSNVHPDTTTPRAPGSETVTPSTEGTSQPVVEAESSESSLREKAPPIPCGDEGDTGAAASLSRAEEPTTSSPRRPISPRTSPERAIASPLDQQSPQNIDRAFASLALGGESYGGWQTGWGSHDNAAAIAASSMLTTSPNNDDDDDDDDTPIGQTARFRNAGSPQPSGSPVPAKRSEGAIPSLFIISVEDPQKVGDPIRAHTLYTVHTRTSSPLFSKATFSVLRRYSDFLWLYETLCMNNPGVVVPPAPEKNPFGRFDEQFIQQRRLALEKCIQKIANHPVLCKDPDLKFFLESDNFALDIKHRKAEMAHEKGGLMASIGQTLTGPRFHETDEWFDKQRAYLDGLESQLRGLVRSIEFVARQRAELASGTREFAMAIAELSASDIGEQLQQTLGVLANVEQAAAEAQNIQSQQDMITLMSTADEYSRLINSVRLAFGSRVRTYMNWQNADAEVRRVRQIHERARAQGRVATERGGHTVSLVTEAERRALDAKHEFEQCSKLIKSEMARFEQERVDDFKEALEAFLNGMLSRQKELISAWENYQQMLLKRVGGPASDSSAVAVSVGTT